MEASSKKIKAENLFIAAKVRPCSDKTNLQSSLTIDSENSTITVKSKNKEFHLNNVFDENATQETIYVAQPIVDDFLGGINGTIFAYGHTGSGKTYTMNGNKISETSESPTRGIIPRSIESIFEYLNGRLKKDPRSFTFSIKCRFVEIYNANLYDLFQSNGATVNIQFSGEQINVGSAEFVVTSIEECLRHLRNGWKNRKTAETSMNRESSRSHAIFMLTLVTENVDGTFVNRRTSCLNFVDLAGSERQSQTNNTGERLKEAGCINKDLSFFANIIRILGDAKEGEYIPYRNCLLTHLLRDSLGGNSRTSVIVTVHPNLQFVNDTLSTLNFAENCKKVKNKAKVNEAISTKDVEAWKAEKQKAQDENVILKGEIENLSKENQELKERIEKRQKEDANIILILQNEKKTLKAESAKYVQEVNEEKQNLQTQIFLLEKNVAEQIEQINVLEKIQKEAFELQLSQMKEENDLKIKEIMNDLREANYKCEEMEKEKDDALQKFDDELNKYKLLVFEKDACIQESKNEMSARILEYENLLENTVAEQKEQINALETSQKEASELQLAQMQKEYDLKIKKIMADFKKSNERCEEMKHKKDNAFQKIGDELRKYKLLVAEKDEIIEKSKNEMDAKIFEYETLLEKIIAEHKKQKKYDLKIKELEDDLKKANEKVEDKQSDTDFNASFGGGDYTISETEGNQTIDLTDSLVEEREAHSRVEGEVQTAQTGNGNGDDIIHPLTEENATINRRKRKLLDPTQTCNLCDVSVNDKIDYKRLNGKTLLVHRLRYSNRKWNIRHEQGVKPKEIDFEHSDFKIFPQFSLDLNNHQSISSIVNRIICTGLKHLLFSTTTILLPDFKKLTANKIVSLDIFRSTVNDENGIKVEIDKIWKEVENAETLKHNFCDGEVITTEIAQNLSELPTFPNLLNVYLWNVQEGFDLETFGEFIRKNPTIVCCELNFGKVSNEFSQEMKRIKENLSPTLPLTCRLLKY
uniref:Kinesin motor domain-containing protein n=1 Tax=Panagrolaimus sp. PS1159 TaxID=55785 RepID=A0AC35GAH7_9BILA